MDRFQNISKISPEELRQWMDEGRDLVLIDTLPQDHFQKVHLQGAKNACVFEISFLDQAKAVAANRASTIVVYGSRAGTMDALTAAEKLIEAGYTQVYALEGGIDQCRSIGFSLAGQESDQPEKTRHVLCLEDRTYQVNTEQSLIEWAGRNPNSKHHGTVQLTAGKISVTSGKVTGNFDINMNSLKNINLEGDPLQPVLISHLKSDDFFFVKMFPKASFALQSAFPLKNPTVTAPNYEVHGILELRGVRAELQFFTTLNKLDDGQIAVEAHFDIDRTRWNIIYGSSRFFEHLGMHLVFDPINIQLKILAV